MCEVIPRDLVNLSLVRKAPKKTGRQTQICYRYSAMTSQVQTDCIIYSQVNIKTDLQTERKIQTVLLIEFLISWVQDRQKARQPYSADKQTGLCHRELMDRFDWQADRQVCGSPVSPIMVQGCSLYCGSCHSSIAQMTSHSSRGRAATGWESMSSFSFLPPLGDVSLDKGAAVRTIGTTD